ncbi:MAG: DUF1987 domain-containing protein [Cytophagales bacterium]|nr:DUF1987 domain-containing protein [Cytophagales bacterium]
MKILKIDPTGDTPAILLDADKGVFKITGRSMPEDAQLFYQTVLDWVTRYAEEPNSETNFVFKLEYFNTASAKLILDILIKLEEIHNRGKKTIFTWYYHANNKDMKEAGEKFGELVEIPYNMLQID